MLVDGGMQFLLVDAQNIFLSGREYPCYATDHAMSAIIIP